MTGPLAQSLDAAVEQGVFPGAVALVAQQRDILFHEAFGHAALVPSPRLMHRGTLFDIASLTKPVATTTAIMLLVEQGCLQLEDRAARFVPEFAGGGKEAITVGHLMSHSSGLPSWVPFYEAAQKQSVPRAKGAGSSPGPSTGLSPAQQVYDQIHAIELECAPGTKTIYSDVGFILLGELIERITQTALDAYVHEAVFDRLGMSTSFYNRGNASDLRPEAFAATELSAERGGVMCGQVHDENAWFMGGVSGHAGVFSTAHDLSLLVTALLEALAGRSDFLSRDTVARFVSRANVVEQSSRAYGWDTPSEPSSSGKLFSARSFGHIGFTGTSIWADRDRGLFVILLTNRVHPTRDDKKIWEFRPYFHDLVMSHFGNG